MLGKRARPASSACGSSSTSQPQPRKRRAINSPSPHPSLSISGCSLPLTKENLASLPNMASRTGSLTRKRTTVDPRAERVKMDKYNIEVDTMASLPTELRILVDAVFCAPRAAPTSPNASRMVALRRAASIKNEKDAIRLVAHLLLFEGQSQTERPHGVKGILSAEDAYLSPEFLPKAPSPDVSNFYGKLAQAVPDTAIGYLTYREARMHDPLLETVFSKQEDAWLSTFALNQAFHIPFLTSQWKTPTSAQTHFHAQTQGSRDGATIVNYLHDLYSVAYARNATPLEAHHISITTDIQTVKIWIHWRAKEADASSPTHYMSCIHGAMWDDEIGLSKARRILHNVLGYATGPRLDRIKSALPLFQERRGNRVILGAAPSDSESVAVSSVASSVASSAVSAFVGPPTPSSVVDKDPTKRSNKRKADDVDVGLVEADT